MREPIKTDEDHRIIFQGMHDAEVNGFLLSYHERNLVLQLQKESGETFQIHLMGISDFYINDFAHQNVIFAAYAYTKTDVLQQLTQDKQNLGLTDERILSLKNSIESGERYFFELHMSVGCDVSCICEKIEISA